MIVFPFILQVQLLLLLPSFCKILGWSILIQSFAKFIMGAILVDTAILGNASKKEPLCSYYEHTSRACLQLDERAAKKTCSQTAGSNFDKQKINESCLFWIQSSFSSSSLAYSLCSSQDLS